MSESSKSSSDIVSSLSIGADNQAGAKLVDRGGASNAEYVPSFPLKIQLALVEAKAEVALPLVLAIHRQLTMTHRQETPLNEAVWRAAGSPSARRRHIILQKLKRLPSVLELIEARSSTSRYRLRRGELWKSSSCYPRGEPLATPGH